MMILDRETAETYASWFRCVADPTRLQILHVLAGAGRSLRVGEVAEAVGVAQSTVSVHLRRLLEAEFVHVERVGTASWFAVNQACVSEFPAAASAVMACLAGDEASGPPARPPWHRSDAVAAEAGRRS
ncbi:MAG: ArsR/SmtB family transcription factor [Actinomycetes bacterium]